MDLGAAIKAARESAGKTQGDLAEAVERTQVYVSFLECGRRAPSDACLDAIAKALGTTARSIRAKAAGFASRDDRAGEQRSAKALGEAIRAARATVDRTQREVAEAAEIEPAYLAQIEGGWSRPSEALLDRIATELGTTVQALRQRATVQTATGEQATKRREKQKAAEEDRAAKRREKREARRVARAARRRETAKALAAKRRESARVRREKERAARADRKRKRAAKRAEERAARREAAKARAAERKTKKRTDRATRKAAKREREAKRAEEREAERPLREAERRAEQERRSERKKAEREAERRGREARRGVARRRALHADLTPSAGDIESLADDIGMRAPRRIAGSDLVLATGRCVDVDDSTGRTLSFWGSSDDVTAEEFQVVDADEGLSVLNADDELELLRPRKARMPKTVDYALTKMARFPVRRSAGRSPRRPS